MCTGEAVGERREPVPVLPVQLTRPAEVSAVPEEEPLVAMDSSTGRVFVLSPTISAVWDGREWREGSISADDLNENFEPIMDSSEASAFAQLARTALSSSPRR